MTSRPLTVYDLRHALEDAEDDYELVVGASDPGYGDAVAITVSPRFKTVTIERP
jgi:hypothetical protein